MLYTYMHICIVYKYICAYTSIYMVYMYIYKCACMCICVCMYVSKYLYTHKNFEITENAFLSTIYLICTFKSNEAII